MRIILLAVLTAILWMLYDLSGSYGLFAERNFTDVLYAVAVVVTAILAVFVGGWLFLGICLSRAAGLQLTGLERAIVYGALTFIASSLALRSIGFDLGAMLTTSAIITVAIGLAMQPTLGSLISGVTLRTDRVLAVGDGIVINDMPVEVVSLNWRVVVTRTLHGKLVVFPNSLLANDIREIYRRNDPILWNTIFHVPMTEPPQRISDLVEDLVGDLVYVDKNHFITVTPIAFEVKNAAIKYRIRYWVKSYLDVFDVEAEVSRRLWYGFQRHGIAFPISNLYDEELRQLPDAEDLLPESCDYRRVVIEALRRGGDTAFLALDGAAAEAAAEATFAAGTVLLYAPTEQVTIPRRYAGWAFVLLAGEVTACASDFEAPNHLDHARPPGFAQGTIQRPSHRTAIKHIAKCLARYIGPYAEFAVMKVATNGGGINDLCRTVAEEISDERQREAFLNEVHPPEEHRFGPGLVFEAQRGAANRYVSKPAIRACDQVAVLAVPKNIIQFPAAITRRS